MTSFLDLESSSPNSDLRLSALGHVGHGLLQLRGEQLVAHLAVPGEPPLMVSLPFTNLPLAPYFSSSPSVRVL